MSIIRKTTIAAVGAVAAAIYLAAPASADPNVSPCGLAFVPFCALIPVLPDLDHDVDLTKDPGAVSGAGGDLQPGTGYSGG
ncbi:MAG TPA: fibronectin-binding protein [Mycobacterium sp.]|uniref:fibronectin-binding protein n=1 Tax=Mycobacterium sp. TaxID=1785 RepID=UPI002CDE3628|nr:fibronectin-binding protein [Mycobacterium sp.]HME75610.1 fibronectin-binding protein [Mycobacterium sp.]